MLSSPREKGMLSVSVNLCGRGMACMHVRPRERVVAYMPVSPREIGMVSVSVNRCQKRYGL